MQQEPDALDVMLDRANPESIVLTPEISSSVRAMVAASRSARFGRLRRFARTPIALGLVAALSIGGAGVAVASGAAADWFSWAQQPDGVVRFELPSGALCEMRIGEIVGEPEATPVAAEILGDPELLDRIDLEAAFAMVEVSDPPTDNEYRMSVSWAVGEYLAEELRERGIQVSVHSFQAQSICPGAEW